MADFTGKSHEWLAGYHAAMAEIAQECSRGTAEMEQAQINAKPTFFCRPTPEHHRLAGAGKAMTEICTLAFERGNLAFASRNQR